MATTGMFDWNPKSQLQLQQEYLQGIIGDNADVSARLGANIGYGLGRMFGGQTAQEAEQALMKEAFDEAAQAATPEEGAKIAIKRLRSKGLEGRARQLEAELLKKQEAEANIAFKKAQTEFYGVGKDPISKLLTSGKYTTESVAKFKESGDPADLVLAPKSTGGAGAGTGPERMIAIVSAAQTKLAKGETLTEEERITAANTADFLSKQGQFQDKDGNIVNVDRNKFAQLAATFRGSQAPTQAQPPVAGQQPAVSTGQAAPSPVPGRTVTPTPYSESLKNKEAAALDMSIQGINDALLAGEPLKQLAPSGAFGATWSAVSSALPWSDARAMNNYVQSIKSQKTLDTLAQLKNQSKTGATGFGSLTEKELNLIDAKVRVLDPLSKTFREDLNYVLKGFADIRDKLSKERNTLGGAKEAGPSTKQEVLIQDTMSKNPNKTREQVIQGLKKLGVI
jgi:hypothetical protein